MSSSSLSRSGLPSKPFSSLLSSSLVAGLAAEVRLAAQALLVVVVQLAVIVRLADAADPGGAACGGDDEAVVSGVEADIHLVEYSG